ncbi:MAG: energy-coupling factor transporter ATPase [Erysipelotrichaceae bacterium]|jgi:energy-coupling factor transport system ATP-binding protein
MSIHFEKVDYIYNPNTVFEFKALEDVNLDINMGKITAIIGATGSGKTTLVQHLNGLLLPAKGFLTVNDFTIRADEKPKKIKDLRKQVGLVFQFAEYQLFEETLIKDVAFGPKNFGVDENEAETIAKRALVTVGIDPKDFNKSPLELSGGQKRRVAIAGILAMSPSILVLDEPTAGLDPQGAKSMMELFDMLNREKGITILIVTHNMEHVLDYCDEVVVLEEGKVIMHTDKKEFFRNEQYMEKASIDPPVIIAFKKMCEKNGVSFDSNILTLDKLVSEIVRKRGKR